MSMAANIARPYVVGYAATGDEAGRYSTLEEAKKAQAALNLPEGESMIVKVDPAGQVIDWL